MFRILPITLASLPLLVCLASITTSFVVPPTLHTPPLAPTCKPSRLFSFSHERMTLSTASELFIKSQCVALRCLYHPFVFGLASGKLPQAAFQNYVGQDFFFLQSFSDAYTKAGSIAKEKGDTKGAEKFAKLANGVAEELKMHETYAARWGLDMKQVKAQAATVAYVKFLKDTTNKQKQISVICAAMAPCMRLYAFLGQSLYHALPEGVKGNPYQEWIESYRSDDFEGLAVTLEEMLDGYAQEENTTTDDLFPHFNKAMDLEFEFFDAQSGMVGSVLEPVPVLGPEVLAVDFDQTITVEDTTAVIAEQSRAALGSEEKRAARKESWDSLASDFYAKYLAQIDMLMPKETHKIYDHGALHTFCVEMSKFDKASIEPVEEGGFLAGISKESLKTAATGVDIRVASFETMRSAVSRGAKLHIVSVNWSQDFIRSALSECPEFQLHSPDLEFEGGVSTGRLLPGGISGSVEKETVVDQICRAGTSSGSVCVYIGDSITDILALLRADVGIVVGHSSSLRRLCSAFGVTLRPLVGSVLGKQEKGILYSAVSWHDISLALYGTTAP